MVDRNEAVIASGITSAAIAGTFLLAKSVPMLNTEGALAITIFSSSFVLSYTGMRGYLPF